MLTRRGWLVRVYCACTWHYCAREGDAQIASQTGLSREQLYRSFSKTGNPTLKTTISVMKALGIELTAKVHA
ncbi:addiction module antidote protein [Acidisphaera sp. S103]|uniref:addiction module antidote protein n=1 Tax=Acidisphaera sp. S103 TaxID=1747223 RepID=UPI0020B167B7|nr:addiction module antidote protein [Acidisphaera sp. S103]